jgi:hypothetical protein
VDCDDGGGGGCGCGAGVPVDAVVGLAVLDSACCGFDGSGGLAGGSSAFVGGEHGSASGEALVVDGLTSSEPSRALIVTGMGLPALSLPVEVSS